MDVAVQLQWCYVGDRNFGVGFERAGESPEVSHVVADFSFACGTRRGKAKPSETAYHDLEDGKKIDADRS